MDNGRCILIPVTNKEKPRQFCQWVVEMSDKNDLVFMQGTVYDYFDKGSYGIFFLFFLFFFSIFFLLFLILTFFLPVFLFSFLLFLPQCRLLVGQDFGNAFGEVVKRLLLQLIYQLSFDSFIFLIKKVFMERIN